MQFEVRTDFKFHPYHILAIIPTTFPNFYFSSLKNIILLLEYGYHYILVKNPTSYLDQKVEKQCCIVVNSAGSGSGLGLNSDSTTHKLSDFGQFLNVSEPEFSHR